MRYPPRSIIRPAPDWNGSITFANLFLSVFNKALCIRPRRNTRSAWIQCNHTSNVFITTWKLATRKLVLNGIQQIDLEVLQKYHHVFCLQIHWPICYHFFLLQKVSYVWFFFFLIIDCLKCNNLKKLNVKRITHNFLHTFCFDFIFNIFQWFWCLNYLLCHIHKIYLYAKTS